MSDPPYTFDSPDADVILRASLHSGDPGSAEFNDFHAHKIILSTASTVFRDMFSLPQSPEPSEGNASLPIVHISEPPEIFETFLRFIYPIEPPLVNSLQVLYHLSQLASKYVAGCVRARLRQLIISPSFLRSDPIWVYIIACCMDLEEDAKLAISYSYHINLVQDIPHPLLQAMTTVSYNRLLRSHATRREELRSAIKKAAGGCLPFGKDCDCGRGFYTSLMKNIRLAISERPALDRERLDLCSPRIGPMRTWLILQSVCAGGLRVLHKNS